MKKGLLLLMVVLSIPRARAEETFASKKSNLSLFGMHVGNKGAENALQGPSGRAPAGLRLFP